MAVPAALAGELFGDFSGVAALPAVLARLRYSREMENKADEYAIALLRKNGISTLPLADLFERMAQRQAKSKDQSGWFRQAAAFMSSHPLTAERSARLRCAAQPPGIRSPACAAAGR